jgi:cell division transport system permease protein
MIILTSSARIISFAWKNFVRNAWIWLATVVVLVLALLSVNVLIGVNALSSSAIGALEKKIDLSVYFKPGTPDAVLDQARSYLASLPQAERVDLLTAEQALAAFKERHAGDENILGALAQLDQNPFGAAMTVKARQTDDYPFLIQALANPQFDFAVESQTYDDHAAAIERVRQIAKTIRYFGAVLTAIFVLFSALIVYNAIRVAIYTMREEIGIMRLVGASNAFVRLPLIVDAIFLAGTAVAVSLVLLIGMIAFLEPRIRVFFDGADPGLQSYYMDNSALLLSVQGVVLACVVTLAAWAAVGRYLKR